MINLCCGFNSLYKSAIIRFSPLEQFFSRSNDTSSRTNNWSWFNFVQINQFSYHHVFIIFTVLSLTFATSILFSRWNFESKNQEFGLNWTQLEQFCAHAGINKVKLKNSNLIKKKEDIENGNMNFEVGLNPYNGTFFPN